MELTVVMYHYVRDLKNSRYPNIKGLDIANFKKQISYLKSKYDIIRLEDVVNWYEKGIKWEGEKKACLLTFDDGYKEHFTNVLPVLLEEEIQGTFFIPTQLLSEPVCLDVNKIHLLLATTDDKIIVEDIKSWLDENKDKYTLEDYDVYYKKYHKMTRYDSPETTVIKRLLQFALEEDAKDELVNKLFTKYVKDSESLVNDELYMTIDQVKVMDRLGMGIAYHTHTHQWLGQISREKQIDEMQKSEEVFREMGIDCKVISYPYGSYNNDTLDLCEKRGITLAFTTEARVADLSKDAPLLIPRLDTNDLPIEEDENV
ncbi:TPA: polysaccharide deacetylase family protein [Streptococcus suis]|nr:polysaccharide deacetylase family protein [Streptococcus suis]